MKTNKQRYLAGWVKNKINYPVIKTIYFKYKFQKLILKLNN